MTRSDKRRHYANWAGELELGELGELGQLRLPGLLGGDGQAIRGRGTLILAASRPEVWALLLDPSKLAAIIIPGCGTLEPVAENAFRAEMSLGAGPVKGWFKAEVTLTDLDEPRALRITGRASGSLGESQGEGGLVLTETEDGTRIDYRYAFLVTGKAAAIGGRMLDGATRALMKGFFSRLASEASAMHQ